MTSGNPCRVSRSWSSVAKFCSDILSVIHFQRGTCFLYLAICSLQPVFSFVLILFALVGYLVGSVPVAYLVTKYRTGIDLRIEGSKNIGTLNSFEVTKNRTIAIAVLVLDLLKG